MKTDEYVLIETTLLNAADLIQEDIIETCDTSFKDSKYENVKDVEEWNKRLNDVLSELITLRAEMIFTFKIEDE